MKRLLNAAFKTLPLMALIYFAGIVAIAFLDLSTFDTRTAFAIWSLATLAIWAVGCHEVMEQDGE